MILHIWMLIYLDLQSLPLAEPSCNQSHLRPLVGFDGMPLGSTKVMYVLKRKTEDYESQ